jgi:hypothetical protein
MRTRARNEGLEPTVIVGAVLGIHVECDDMAGADGVHADTALKAGSGAPAELALHVVFGEQILGLVGDMQEAVHQLAAFPARTTQFRVLGRQPVGLGDRVDGRPQHGMVDGLVDVFAQVESVQTAPMQGFEVILRGDDRLAEGRPELFDCFHDVSHFTIDRRTPVRSRQNASDRGVAGR